ncbi:MAG: ATP-binding protein [Thermaerobacter sp.]|nr:ATP-binding protein [Thermaerobacter sp.]
MDREDFMVEAVERLFMGNNVMVAGPRRIGKSSVAGEVRRRLQSRGAYTAYVDLFRTSSLEELATRLLESVLANRTGPLAAVARGVQDLRRMLAQARVSATIHDLDLAVALLERPHGFPADTFELALSTADRLAKHDQRRVVLVFDEFQDIDQLGGVSLQKRMRSVLQQQSHTACLFLGSQADLMEKLFGSPRAVFFRFALPMHLPPTPWAAWAAYLVDRLAAQHVTIDEPALALLAEKTGGHPHGVMVVMDAALMRTRLAGTAAITADDVLYGYASALDTLGGLYAQQWIAVRARRNAPRVLMAVAEGRPPYANRETSAGSVAKAITWLTTEGLIASSARGEHHVVEPMFAAWLKTLHGAP